MVTTASRFTGCLRVSAALAALQVGVVSLPAQVVTGDRFPSLAPAAPAGGALPDTAGKVVVVDFWASWCAPCKASFPVYSRLQADYAGRGLVVVGVGVDDDPSAYAGFVSRLRPSFATLHDAHHALVGAVQVPTMPTSYVMDRGGKVRFTHAGFHGDPTDRELRREIDLLLAENPPVP